MAQSNILGYPRIGPNRELKKATESYWAGKISQKELLEIGSKIRIANWKLQQTLGIDLIPSNDFSFYDHVLDTICLVGAVPEHYGWNGKDVDLDTYFAMARGKQSGKVDVVAMEMTKWFDTNYHYIVPEFTRNQSFNLSSSKLFDEFSEAKSQGIITKPVLLGPVSFLLLGKEKEKNFNGISLLPRLLPVYKEILQRLNKSGAKWIQIDEPFLALDLNSEMYKQYEESYKVLAESRGNLKILLATYFEGLKENTEVALSLPVDALHIDLVRASQELDNILKNLPKNIMLSCGVVDGRNIWKNNFERSFGQLEKIKNAVGSDRMMISPSCSLLHIPYDLDNEIKLDSELKSYLAFAKQKIKEVSLLTKAVNEGRKSVAGELAVNAKVCEMSRTSTKVHNKAVKERVKNISSDDLKRHSSFSKRFQLQHSVLGLQPFSTTTIGSFPQTTEVRTWRAKLKKGEITQEKYESLIKEEITRVIKWQQKIGMDVLVHGEAERNDMVEYFGEQLNGFAFTENGWVQSYGSRCVKPPIIFGDVSRPHPMTVKWSKYAQSLTTKLVKGMLTGPITILQWSFVRDDEPRSETTKQIALSIRDEVLDLEKAGIKIIQIDEPAIREGLPLRKKDWGEYLKWAVESFKLSSCGVKDETQIHTHMCYSEFNDIIDSISKMDADVISIETSRSQMELLNAFSSFHYPNQIGPGVYDIHSPRIPTTEEMVELLEKAARVIDPKRLWVNPDCGLKTRGWEETKISLQRMIEAAHKIREKLSKELIAK